MSAAYWCEHPECNGKHGHAISIDQRCPAATESKNAAERTRYANKMTDPAWAERERQRNRDRMTLYNVTAAGMLASLRFKAKQRGNR